jgi:hypothetical protein
MIRALVNILALLGVIGLAHFAYGEHLRTQQARAELRGLDREIEQLRTSIAMERAEWAFLNRPERLRELTTASFGHLRLLPFGIDNFGRADQIAYPMTPLPDLSGVVETLADTEVPRR